MDDLERLAQAQRASRYVRPVPRRKGYKGHQLAGGTLVVLGFVLWVVGVKLNQSAEYDMRPDDPLWMAVTGAGLVAFIIGTIWFLGARLVAWWRD